MADLRHDKVQGGDNGADVYSLRNVGEEDLNAQPSAAPPEEEGQDPRRRQERPAMMPCRPDSTYSQDDGGSVNTQSSLAYLAPVVVPLDPARAESQGVESGPRMDMQVRKASPLPLYGRVDRGESTPPFQQPFSDAMTVGRSNGTGDLPTIYPHSRDYMPHITSPYLLPQQQFPTPTFPHYQQPAWSGRFPFPTEHYPSGNQDQYSYQHPQHPVSTSWENAYHLSPNGLSASNDDLQEGTTRGYTARQNRERIKAQRIRLLEREFGKPKIGRRNGTDDDDDVEGEEMEGEYQEGRESSGNKTDSQSVVPLGHVRGNGTLQLPHRKTVLISRWLFLLATLGGAFFAILATVVVQLPVLETDVPVEESHWTTWLMHAVACASAPLLLWILLLKGCLCDPARRASKTKDDAMTLNRDAGYTGLGMGGAGAMIVPMIGTPSSSAMDGQRLLGKKKAKMQGATVPVPTINFIVDPTLFGRRSRGYPAGRGGTTYSSSSDERQDEADGEEDAESTQGQIVVKHAKATDLDDFDSFDESLRTHQAQKARAKRQRRRQQRRRRRVSPLSSHISQRDYLDRLRRRRIHDLALSSLQSILLLCLLVLALQSAGLIFMFAFSAAPVTSCTSQGSSWCAVWGGEVACIALALACGVIWEGFGWMGWRLARREGRKEEGRLEGGR